MGFDTSSIQSMFVIKFDIIQFNLLPLISAPQISFTSSSVRPGGAGVFSLVELSVLVSVSAGGPGGPGGPVTLTL